jgi:hypothetical protein
MVPPWFGGIRSWCRHRHRPPYNAPHHPARLSGVVRIACPTPPSTEFPEEFARSPLPEPDRSSRPHDQPRAGRKRRVNLAGAERDDRSRSRTHDRATEQSIEITGQDHPQRRAGRRPDRGFLRHVTWVPLWRRDQGISDTTIGHEIVFLRGALDWATTKRQATGRAMLLFNPIAEVKRIRSVAPDTPVASEETFLRVYRYADRVCAQKLFRSFLLLVHEHGWRLSAWCALRANDVDLRSGAHFPYGRIRKRAETDKARRAGWKPMTPRARGAVELLLRRRPAIGTPRRCYSTTRNPTRRRLSGSLSGQRNRETRTETRTRPEGNGAGPIR